ncbi:MAG: ABC transporter substrate-binding protein, partial [Clostridiales bacterium]
MKKKLAIVFGVIVFMLFSLTACGNSSEKTQSTDDSATTVMFTDSAGREVELPKNINRIVSTGPLSQIILFALAPDDLVAINDEWNEKNKPYIDAGYYDLPVLGSVFGGADLNVEQLVATNPQVIIDIGEAKDSIKKDMEDLQVQTGIPVIHIDATINTMGDTFKTLGKLLNCKSQGEKLASYCETTNKSTLAIMDKVGAENKTKVLYCLGSDGLSVMAENSYHSEILNLVANNVAKVDNPASKGTGTAINMEQLMIWDPDVIL